MRYSEFLDMYRRWLSNMYRISYVKVASYSLLTFIFTILPIQQSMAVGLAQSPVFTQFSAKPNIITLIDDSGSMDSEVLLPTNDGALWWSTSSDSFEDGGSLHGNFGSGASDSWKKYVYLFPNGTGTGRRVYSDSSHDHYAIPPIIQYAYARSSDYNKAYYDPDVTYEPWVDYGTTDFTNITASAAPSDPVSAASVTLDLANDYQNKDSNYTFKMHDGAVIPKGTTYYEDSWKTASSDITLSSTKNVGIEYYPATYYVKITTGTYTVDGTAGDCSTPNAAHHTLLKNAPGSFTSSEADSLSYDGACLEKIEIKSANAPFTNDGSRTDCGTIATSCTYDQEIQNFANWYSYYRKRHLALRAGMGGAFDGMSDIRVGLVTINHLNNVTMVDFDSDSDTFFEAMYDVDGNSGGTPNRVALNYVGNQYKRTDSSAPITEECQRNFTIQFTDGFSTLNDAGVGNIDGSKGVPYSDSYSGTLADIAMQFYSDVLRTDFTAGQVPTPSGCSETDPDPILDCNDDLHMNTYTVGLGATGDSVFGITHFDVEDAYETDPTWPDPNGARDKTQIDDLYHAAVNGRGEMYNAETTKDLQSSLQSALVSIKAQIGSAASATFNTSTLQTESRVYLTLFNSSGWSGDLKSYSLSPTTGAISSDADWSAADVLDARDISGDPRVIITHDGDDGIAFNWTDINALGSGNVLYDDLTYDGDATDGQDRLNYIRGDRTKEGAGQFRLRNSRLGDIVHSAAIYVGEPSINWPDTLPVSMDASGIPTDIYSVFKSSTSRTPVIYVGGNDGMLHGFKAESGEEVLAYIPHSVYSDQTSSGLHYLTQADYTHRFYVDRTPTVSDAVISNSWKTILIGTLGAGGKGVFALDVTDPSIYSEDNAADIALWEFTADDDTGLGYTYSEPVITMTNNGQWAVIFGNGYNSSDDTASLFILFISQGIDGSWGSSDYVKLTTDSTAGNGLSSPAVIDTDGDGDADLVYAGDLKGNLWKFDISDSSTSEWTTLKLFSAGSSKPITVAPTVTDHPSVLYTGNHPNLMIYFGTGQYLSIDDVSNTDTQTFYGVWDNGDNKTLDDDDLQQQTITSISGGRVVTDNDVDYLANGVNKEYGWYMNLPDSGERVVAYPVARGDNIFFNTTVPTNDPCAAGGYGWLMVVDANFGSPPVEQPAFDFNNDGVVDENDYVEYDDKTLAPIGVRFDGGLPSSPAILGDKQYTTSTTTESGDEIDVRDIEEAPGDNTGRLSWEELFE